MFLKCVTQASTSFDDIDLVTCVAFGGIKPVLVDTGRFRCKSKVSIWSIDKCGGVDVEANIAARSAIGQRIAVVLISCSRVIEGASD